MNFVARYFSSKMAINASIISLLLFISILSLVACFRQVCSSFPADSVTAFRPCQINDIPCIRKALDCELPAPRFGPLVSLDEMTLYLPYFNSTFTQAPLISEMGLGNIDLFSLDHVRRRITVKLTFTNVWINGTTEIYHFTSGLVTNTYVSEFYDSIKITAELFSSKSFDMDYAQIFTDFTTPRVFDFGDCFQQNPEPELLDLIKSLVKNRWVAAAEMFVVRSRQIIENFIDNFVCDI